jgi:hypothetical protein
MDQVTDEQWLAACSFNDRGTVDRHLLQMVNTRDPASQYTGLLLAVSKHNTDVIKSLTSIEINCTYPLQK